MAEINCGSCHKVIARLNTHTANYFYMKTLFFLFSFISVSMSTLSANEIDSLLTVLDKTIAERPLYISKKESKIKELKSRLDNRKSLDDEYAINERIISEYQSFQCDSAIAYINKNITIAEKLNNKEYLWRGKLSLSFILSISGLFTQALETLNLIRYDELPIGLRPSYCWNYIRYYENLMKYTDDYVYESSYLKEKEKYRDILISLLDENSDMYLKEKAFRLQDEGQYKKTYDILLRIFLKQEVSTHGYAMDAMSLAMVNKYMNNSYLEEKYLILAALTDIQLSVKENEALLALAIYLYDKGDMNRAYNYIRVALDDANFFNSRFRNTVIARVYPIIEDTYLYRIEQQKHNLRVYSILTSLFVIALIIALYFIYRQVKIVSRARRNLKITNEQLVNVNRKLDEVNLVKERYIGVFMNQCAIYIDKLDDFRKNVNRKIKAGQVDDLLKLTSSSRDLEKDVEELYNTFDRAFFKIYPNFVEEFNSLLKEDERYKLGKDRLNTELRIFALIRLGINDVDQIATFLRYSIQTIYNYKSKVKGKAIESENFENEVRMIGNFS